MIPVLWQLMLKRTRFRTIMFTWLTVTMFVLASILRFKAFLQIYTLLYSLPFLYIHYETERFLKASYLQSTYFIQEIFKQQKREKRNAIERVNYEKMMEAKQYSKEINHLKILIGTYFFTLFILIIFFILFFYFFYLFLSFSSIIASFCFVLCF